MGQGFQGLRHAALLALLAGCFEMGPIFGPESSTPSSGCWFCVTYDLMAERGIQAMLKGDTMQVLIVSTIGHDQGTFTVTGTALKLLTGNALTTEITTPATRARVVGVAAGRDTVRSRAADTAATALLAIGVIDSASITAIQTGLEPNAKLRVGEMRHLDVWLYAGLELVQGGPTSMAVGHPAIVSAEPAQLNPKGIFLRANAVGKTNLTIRFLERSQTYAIEVIP